MKTRNLDETTGRIVTSDKRFLDLDPFGKGIVMGLISRFRARLVATTNVQTVNDISRFTDECANALRTMRFDESMQVDLLVAAIKDAVKAVTTIDKLEIKDPIEYFGRILVTIIDTHSEYHPDFVADDVTSAKDIPNEIKADLRYQPFLMAAEEDKDVAEELMDMKKYRDAAAEALIKVLPNFKDGAASFFAHVSPNLRKADWFETLNQ